MARKRPKPSRKRRRNLAAEAHAHEVRLATAQEAHGIVTWIWDPATDEVQWYGDVSPLLGLPPRKFKKHFRDYLKHLHPDDVAQARASLHACMKGTQPVYRQEERVIWPDGSLHWLETYGHGRYRRGRAIEISGVVRDVTKRKEQELALKLSQEKFAGAFHISPDYMIINRFPRGPILEINAALEQATGYGAREVIGKTFQELGLWAHDSERDSLIDDLERTGAVDRRRVTIRIRDDKLRSASISSRVLDSGGGRVALTVIHDMTDVESARERARESSEKYRAVFEVSPEAIAITRISDRTVLEANDAAVRALGHAREAVVGPGKNPPSFWMDTANRDRIVARLRAERVAVNAPVKLRRADGSPVDVLLSCALIELDGEECIVWSWRDVGELRRAEAQLQELNATLERRVQARTAELEAANRDMESFSYSISHDLRAPVRAVTTFAELLRNRFAEQLPEEGLRLLSRVDENARRMAQLIEDLLEFSRTGRGALQVAPVDMRALALDVAEELRAGSPAAVIAVGPLPPARGDASLLRQVWSNLIGNAVKFSRNARPPKIEIGGGRAGTGVEYSVRDNGAGFDMEYAGKLFGVFQRLHTAKEFEGSGVGLAVVQKIVEKHGGRVSGEGAPGLGATFRFTLPD